MFEHGLIWATLLLSFTLLKASLAATLVIYPSYKSYKALESRSLQAAQGMLLYWCMTAFVNSMKEVADQVLGTYSNVFVWKLTVLALKAAPLIIGPERMYTHIIKPLFDANADQVDAVVDEAHKIKSMAQEAVPAVKERDMAAVKSKAGEIAAEVKDATGELVDSAMHSLAETTAALQSKTEQLGVTLNKEGVMGVLEQIMSSFETVRDSGVDVAAQQWKTHGPFVTKQAGVARTKATELYSTHAPVVQQSVLNTYQQQVLPRVQPVLNTLSTKYNESIKPVALAQQEKANALWQAHGGPVRTFYTERALPLYRTKVLPFYNNQLKPFVLHSFLPAVWETVLALKDRLMDLISPPSAELQSQRAAHKERRRVANEKRGAAWKRRGDKVKEKWSGEWKAMEAESQSSGAAASSTAPHSTATLTNRKTGQETDSSLERHHSASAEESTLDPSAPVFEPSAPLATETLLVKEPATLPIDSSAKLQGDKLTKANSPDLLAKEQGDFAGERSGRIAQPIQ